MLIRSLCAAALVGLATGASVAGAEAAVPSKVYVFGNSFVDSDNAFLGTGGLVANPKQRYLEGRVPATPPAYGLTANGNSLTPCNQLRPVTAVGIDCKGLFGIESVRVAKPVQFAIARKVLDQAGLPELPEPGVWLQLVLGFGLAGVVVRLRRVGMETVVA